MPRRAAAVTQAHIARAIRAAKGAGATGVEIRPDGTVLIRLDGSTADAKPEPGQDTPTSPASGQVELDKWKHVVP